MFLGMIIKMDDDNVIRQIRMNGLIYEFDQTGQQTHTINIWCCTVYTLIWTKNRTYK